MRRLRRELDGTPILVFSVAEMLELEKVLIASDLVKLSSPLFVKVMQFKSDVLQTIMDMEKSQQ